jgi:chromosome segregation ATPase
MLGMFLFLDAFILPSHCCRCSAYLDVSMSCFQGSADKLKAELRIVEAEKKQLQEHYLEAMQRVSQLETELDKANAQTRLLEDKLKAVQGRCEKKNGICLMFQHSQSTKYFLVQASHSFL